jgi:hypothetical protein
MQPIDIRALNGSVIQVGDTHIGPVNMAGPGVDYDAIWMPAFRYDDLSVGAIRIQGENSATAQI